MSLTGRIKLALGAGVLAVTLAGCGDDYSRKLLDGGELIVNRKSDAKADAKAWQNSIVMYEGSDGINFEYITDAKGNPAKIFWIQERALTSGRFSERRVALDMETKKDSDGKLIPVSKVTREALITYTKLKEGDTSYRIASFKSVTGK